MSQFKYRLYNTLFDMLKTICRVVLLFGIVLKWNEILNLFINKMICLFRSHNNVYHVIVFGSFRFDVSFVMSETFNGEQVMAGKFSIESFWKRQNAFVVFPARNLEDSIVVAIWSKTVCLHHWEIFWCSNQIEFLSAHCLQSPPVQISFVWQN